MVTDVTPDMRIMQEEIFAPIVPVMTYENFDDAVAFVAGRDKPLALHIFSDKKKNIDKVLSRTSSGGVNQSGMGSYHGEFGFRAFSHDRAVYMRENG